MKGESELKKELNLLEITLVGIGKSSETKEAKKTTLKALLIAIFFTVFLYTCVAVSTVSVLDFAS